MSVLQTYFFMFEADTSKVKKGTEEGGKAADDLTKKLNTTDKAAENVGKTFLDLAKSAAKAASAVLALGAIKTITSNTADHTFAVAQQARALDMSVESLSTWQHAVIAAGGSAEGATGSLETLRTKFVEMSRFGAMMGPDSFMFKQLGLSAQDMKDSIKDPTVALGKLAETFGTLNKTQQLYIGKKLGLDQGTIAILSQGREKFEQIIAKQKELGAVTEKQAEAATKYKLAQMELVTVYETVKREITTELLPAFTWVIEKVQALISWFREHKAFAIGFFGGMAVIITTLLVPALTSAAVAMWALLAPLLAVILPILAVGAAFGLVADDVQKFLNGQNSVIGELSKKWPIVGKIVHGVADDIKESMDIIAQAFTDPVKAFERLVALAEKLFHQIEKFKSKALQWAMGKLGFKTPNESPEDAEDGAVANSRTVRANAKGRVIAEKLEKMGWTSAQAAGIAGSFLQESGGDENARNKTSGAYGVGQWLGSRVKDFEKWAGKPLQGSSLDDQLQFFQYEVTKGKERAAGDRLRAATTAAQAASAHSKYYERPGAAEANIARRQALATDILAGQRTIAATAVPIASQTSQTIANSRTSNRTSMVDVGGVNIHTQSTDPKAIRDEFHNSLQGQLSNMLNQYDDGVAI